MMEGGKYVNMQVDIGGQRTVWGSAELLPPTLESCSTTDPLYEHTYIYVVCAVNHHLSIYVVLRTLVI